jgi:hypothetical protein
VGALIVSAALSLFLTGCGHHPKTAVQGKHGMFVMDDFESGALTGWKAVGGGSGGWFVYTDGRKAPDPGQSDSSVPFDLPDPPQGRFAVVSDTNGPGTRILYPQAIVKIITSRPRRPDRSRRRQRRKS